MKLSKRALETKPSSTLVITAEAKKLKKEGRDIVGFTAGEPDFPIVDFIKESAIDAIKNDFSNYTPAAGIEELKEAICNKLNKDNGLSYNKENIVVSNGAKHSLTNTLLAILDKGDEVIIQAPFWLSYSEMVKLADGTPVIINTTEETNFKLTKELLDKHVTSNTKAIMLNSPSNPTGMVYLKEELEMIAEFAKKHDLIVISDEIYEKLLYNEKTPHISIASLDGMKERTVVINGLSKSHGLTGWRIGYLAAPVEIAKAVANMQSHMTSNPNSVAQKASVAALTTNSNHLEAQVKEFKERRDYIYDRIQNIPHLTTLLPDGAFYMFVDVTALLGKEVKGVKLEEAKDVAKVLVSEYDVVVIPCADFGAKNHIRLSYAIDLDSIKKGIDRIEKFVKENY